jgi:hypothetical protein
MRSGITPGPLQGEIEGEDTTGFQFRHVTFEHEFVNSMQRLREIEKHPLFRDSS